MADAEARFRRIAAAYDVLSDPKKKAAVDRGGAGGAGPRGASARPSGRPSGTYFKKDIRSYTFVSLRKVNQIQSLEILNA